LMCSVNGMVTSIISAEMAPEISPKISTVFFISIPPRGSSRQFVKIVRHVSSSRFPVSLRPLGGFDRYQQRFGRAVRAGVFLAHQFSRGGKFRGVAQRIFHSSFREVAAVDQRVAFPLAVFDDRAGKIISESVGLVGFLLGVPGHHQHPFEIAHRPARMKFIDQRVPSRPQLARVHAGILPAVWRERRLRIGFGVVPSADVKFGQPLHLRCGQGWRFLLRVGDGGRGKRAERPVQAGGDGEKSQNLQSAFHFVPFLNSFFAIRLHFSDQTGCLSSYFRMILADRRENHTFEGQNQASRPDSLPSCTAWVRRLAPNLSKTRLEWVFTVFSLTKSLAAISRLLRPWAINSRISSSRGVIPRISRFFSSGIKGSAPGARRGAGTCTGTSPGTSLITTVCCVLVSFRPSQMPRTAKIAAVRPP